MVAAISTRQRSLSINQGTSARNSAQAARWSLLIQSDGPPSGIVFGSERPAKRAGCTLSAPVMRAKCNGVRGLGIDFAPELRIKVNGRFPSDRGQLRKSTYWLNLPLSCRSPVHPITAIRNGD